MEIKQLNSIFDNYSQRVACSYLRSLTEFTPVMPAGFNPLQQREIEAAQRDLHAFFQSFYELIYQDPAVFGLPVTPDVYLRNDGSETQKQKQEINRKIQKPRDMINEGLDFLILTGQKGSLVENGCGLLLAKEDYAGFLQKSRSRKQFLQGMFSTLLSITETDEHLLITCVKFPALWLALKAMAAAYEQASASQKVEDRDLARFNFARCDFRALDKGFHPSPLDLFRVFNTPDYERVAQLHAYFTGLNYKPIFQIYGIFGWEVQYQGKRQVKSSPLIRVQYSERYQKPMRVDIKCASTDRIVKLIPNQPRFLQEDFIRRTNKCGGDACGWCKNHKGLGPSTLEFEGEERTVCWYTNSNVNEMNDDTVRLIEQYAAMHEALA